MRSVVRSRKGAVNELDAKKISISTISGGLNWKQLHNSYTLKTHSVSNINPVGNYVGVVDRNLVVGTDVDKFDFNIYNNASLYIGIATSSKTLDDISDTDEFIASLFNVMAGSVVTMCLTTTHLEITVGGSKTTTSIISFNGQTVSPMIATVIGNTITVNVASKDDLCIYTGEDGVTQFDTTKDIGKSQPLRFNTGGGDVIIDGNINVTGTISGGGAATTTEVTEGINLYYTEDRVSANPTVVSNTEHIAVSDIHRSVNQDLNTTNDVSFNNLTLLGNLTVHGVATTLNTTVFEVKDSTIHIADENPADTMDSAFFMEYNDGSKKYAGLVRDASDKQFYLVNELTTTPVEGTDYNSNKADINVNVLNATQVTCSGDATVEGNLIVESNPPSNPADTGAVGNITWDADYLYVCTTLNNWKRVSISSWISLRILLIGGGGSGGSDNGGGGGAGEFYEGNVSPSSVISITIGVGGTPVTTNKHGLDGDSTSFNNILVNGGGGGGAGHPGLRNGNPGGSGGGGASEDVNGSGGVSMTNNGVGSNGGNGGGLGGGGGGGAGGRGTVGSSITNNIGGVGGQGMQSDITGVLEWYAAGGGGANENGVVGNGTPTNGIGGYTNQNDTNAVGGVDGTGSGGGGQTSFSTVDVSGAGGSGVVIVRIPSRQYKLTWTGTLTGDVVSGANGTIVGADWYYRFTSGTANDVTLVPV